MSYNLTVEFKQVAKSGWTEIVNFNKLEAITDFLNEEHYKLNGLSEIYPPRESIFNAFSFFSPVQCKVIIIGQDPYHGKGQAMGLSFSVPKCVKVPPSLKNIFKEICSDCLLDGYKEDLGSKYKKMDGDLTYLAEKGVLLLNRALTVRERKPNSHQKVWQDFTKDIIHSLLSSSETGGIVVMLWGGNAKSIIKDLDNQILSKHCILEAHHPSPLAANRGGWFGCRHFTKCNAYLRSKKQSPIQWTKDGTY